MTPIRQTTPTNCFAACVAMILNVPIEEVPESFDGAKWDWERFQAWLAQHGMYAIDINLAANTEGVLYQMPNVRCVLAGHSPRGSKLHAVVAETAGLDGFIFVHDPHPFK